MSTTDEVSRAVTALYNAAVATGPTQLHPVTATDEDKAAAFSAALPALFPTPEDALSAARYAASYGDAGSDRGVACQIRYAADHQDPPATGAATAPSWLLLFLDVLTHADSALIPDRATARTALDRITFVPSDTGRAVARLLFVLA